LKRPIKPIPPPKGALLFIGFLDGSDVEVVAAGFPNVKVINRGFGGSQIVDSTHFAERVIFLTNRAKFFCRAGGNDLWAGKSAEQVFGDFKDFVAKVHGNCPRRKLYLFR